MKFPISNRKKIAGILLIECLVYIAVFAVLTGGAMAAFYCCWDNSAALVAQTERIHAALDAGERWRADVRAATGKIFAEPTADGERVSIPIGKNKIIYQFESGEVRRQSQNYFVPLLTKVKASEMKMENRSGVTAWRWELQLMTRESPVKVPMEFTFEAAQRNP